MENPVSQYCRPDQTPHYVASDLVLHCLPMTRLGLSGNNGLILDLLEQSAYKDQYVMKYESIFECTKLQIHFRLHYSKKHGYYGSPACFGESFQ